MVAIGRLALTRKVGQSIRISDNVIVRINGIRGHAVSVLIEAPKNISVHREEVYDELIAKINQQTAVGQQGKEPVAV